MEPVAIWAAVIRQEAAVDIKFSDNVIGGLSSLFNNHKFVVKTGPQSIGINPGADESLVQTVVFGQMVYNGEDELGRPVYSQGIEIEFKNEINDAAADELINSLNNESNYNRCEYKFGKVPEEPADENNNSKNTLFKNNHSYYNFCLPEYDIGSKMALETAMPSALIAEYHLTEESTTSLFYLTKANALPSAVIDSNHTTEFPLQSSHNEYSMNHHGVHMDEATGELLFDSNYYYMCYRTDNFAASEFANRKNFFITSRIRLSSYWYDYPFYNYIELPTTPNNTNFNIRRALQISKHEDIMMRTINYSEPSHILDGKRVWSLDHMLYQEEYTIDKQNLSHYSADGISLYPDIEDSLQVGVEERVQKTGEWEDKQIVLSNRIADFTQNHCLDLKQMYYEKESCEYEMLFHRILKHREGRNTTVQNFHIYRPHNTNYSTNKYFYDTQIRHGAKYSYNFFPCMAQIFHKVTTDNIQNNPGNESAPRSVAIRYTIRPEIRIVEIPVGNSLTTVVEPPPLSPIIKFSNYVNADHKIKISLSDRSGINLSDRFRKTMIPINQQDQIYIDKLYSYNKSMYPYSSQVASFGKFEVYRTTEKPNSVSDFEGQLMQVVDSATLDKYGRKKIKKFYTIHNLEHGKMYYYLFRALTHDNNFSNYSPVYQVQKIKDADNTILNVSSFHFTSIDRSEYNATFRKFLKLGIPDYHTTITSVDAGGNQVESAYGPDVDIHLGDELEDRLWDYDDLTKKYIKLRIESKSTGKKIDLNLIFNYNQPENN